MSRDGSGSLTRCAARVSRTWPGTSISARVSGAAGAGAWTLMRVLLRRAGGNGMGRTGRQAGVQLPCQAHRLSFADGDVDGGQSVPDLGHGYADDAAGGHTVPALDLRRVDIAADHGDARGVAQPDRV